MKLLQFLQYAYLIFAVLFIYDAISKWGGERDRAYISLVFAVIAIFMFFFRRKYANRFRDRGKL